MYDETKPMPRTIQEGEWWIPFARENVKRK